MMKPLAALTAPVVRFCVAALVLGLALGLPGLASAGAYFDYFKAVNMDDAAGVARFIRLGMSPNTVEPDRGDTAMMMALREDSMKVFNVLLNARDTDLGARAANGDDALMIASYKGNVEAVKALLAKGAEVNHHGWSPLHYAAASGSTAIVALLLDASAYIDAESPNGTTPLMMAAREGKDQVVELLLKEGADPSLKNGAGMTAADFARKSDHADIAAILGGKGAGK